MTRPLARASRSIVVLSYTANRVPPRKSLRDKDLALTAI